MVSADWSSATFAFSTAESATLSLAGRYQGNDVK
jgi:hypothetical protein